MYLYKAINDDIFLFMAADIFDAIESCCKTSCGYTSVSKEGKRDWRGEFDF